MNCNHFNQYINVVIWKNAFIRYGVFSHKNINLSIKPITKYQKTYKKRELLYKNFVPLKKSLIATKLIKEYDAFL